MVEIYGFHEAVFKCVPCINAKRLAKMKGLEYQFNSVAVSMGPNGPVFDEGIIKELLERLGRESKVGLSMPQIFVDGEYVGGFDQFKEKLNG